MNNEGPQLVSAQPVPISEKRTGKSRVKPRHLHALGCRADDPPALEEKARLLECEIRDMSRTIDDLTEAHEHIEAEAAVAHRVCRRLAAELPIWRAAAIFFLVLWAATYWRLV